MFKILYLLLFYIYFIIIVLTMIEEPLLVLTDGISKLYFQIENYLKELFNLNQ